MLSLKGKGKKNVDTWIKYKSIKDKQEALNYICICERCSYSEIEEISEDKLIAKKSWRLV